MGLIYYILKQKKLLVKKNHMLLVILIKFFSNSSFCNKKQIELYFFLLFQGFLLFFLVKLNIVKIKLFNFLAVLIPNICFYFIEKMKMIPKKPIGLRTLQISLFLKN